jgi:hypothetical protein
MAYLATYAACSPPKNLGSASGSQTISMNQSANTLSILMQTASRYAMDRILTLNPLSIQKTM